jgi:tRNA(Arg) A34 adenosine deaminase TadA
MAAMVTRKRTVLGVGLPESKTHPLAEKFSKNPKAIYLHAEINAIVNALRIVNVEELYDCEMYVARVKYDKGGISSTLIPGLAAPCEGCMRALLQFKIRKVHFTCDSNPDMNNPNFVTLDLK